MYPTGELLTGHRPELVHHPAIAVYVGDRGAGVEPASIGLLATATS
jgi:hypothetical protein